MPVVQLIVTGDLEQFALAKALSAAFPSSDSGAPVIWRPATKIDEPAKSRLRPIHQVDAPHDSMMKLAESLRTVNLPKSPGQSPPDLLLVIGDVELHNLGNEQSLIEHLQAAVPRMLAERPSGEQASLAAALRERCSYHLFRPMVEATFFGDAQALKVAGVIRLQQPLEDLISCRDVEEFESVDPLWAPECKEKNRKKVAEGKEWWRHERHAKEYLTHLASSKRGGLGYSTNRGFKALSTLHWPTVVNTQPSPYLRALFDDLADWLGVPNPLGPTDPALPRPPTALCADPGRLLRNIPAASAAPSVP